MAANEELAPIPVLNNSNDNFMITSPAIFQDILPSRRRRVYSCLLKYTMKDSIHREFLFHEVNVQNIFTDIIISREWLESRGHLKFVEESILSVLKQGKFKIICVSKNDFASKGYPAEPLLIAGCLAEKCEAG